MTTRRRRSALLTLAATTLVASLASCQAAATRNGVPPSASVPAPASDTLVLTGATVIDGTGAAPIPNATVVIAAGRVVSVRPAASTPVPARALPAGARVMHLAGSYIIPGLIDSHVHITSPFTTAPRQDSILKLLFHGGVTTVRDLAGDAIVLRELARAATDARVPWPRLYFSALFASDSFMNSDRRVEPISRGLPIGQAPWARAVGPRFDVHSAIADAKQTGATGIKLYAGLSSDLVRALANEAHRQGLMVWGHSAILPALPSDAVAAGIDALSHADILVLDPETDRPLAMRDYSAARRYERWPVVSEPITRLLQAMKDRGTILDATLYVTTAQHRRFGIDTTRRHLWPMADWTYAVTRRAREMGVRVAAGTDLMGWPANDSLPFLHDELELLVTRAGFSPTEAITAATLRGAEALGVADSYGTITPGKLADLVILRADPTADIRNTRAIASIVKAGVVHERAWPRTLSDGAPASTRRDTTPGSFQVPHERPPAVSALPTELDAYIAKAREAWNVPGLAIAIVRNDSLVVAKGYGVRELGKPELVDANTVFDIASLAKSFTAAGAAVLVDQGKLGWDDPVRRHLPRVEFPDAYIGANVTLRDLLSHRVGLEAGNLMFRFTGFDRAEVLGQVRFLKPQVPFRTGLVYSNVLYTVAGEATAAAAGTSWAELIRGRLLEPLGMRSSTVDADLPQSGNVAQPHAVFAGMQRPIRSRKMDNTGPAGGIHSTATDMARWLRFQINGGTLDGTRLISEDAMWEMHQPQTPVPITPAFKTARLVEHSAAYGLGWQVMDYRGRRMLWHSGNADGMPSYMAILPDQKLGVAVMLNSWIAPILHGSIAARVLDTYLGVEPRDHVGDLLAGRDAQTRRVEQARRALDSSRITGTTPSRPLARYAGIYVDSLYGDQTVILENGRLRLQMARGQIADLTHWHLDSFRATWRDPVFAEFFSTLVSFAIDERGAPRAFRMILNRDTVVATRVR